MRSTLEHLTLEHECVVLVRVSDISILMSIENDPSSMLIISDVDKLTYRQLQLELKSRKLKAAGKTDVLRDRLRQAIISNEHEPWVDHLDECSICLDKLSFDRRTTVTTTCLHRYHRVCLRRWIESNGEYSFCCPLCRCSLANDRQIGQDREGKVTD